MQPVMPLDTAITGCQELGGKNGADVEECAV